MSDEFNMSMRKFLKQVGVTSQQAIEEALRTAPASQGRSFKARAVITIEELGMTHEIEGNIEAQE